MRKQPTVAELKLWRLLRDRKLDGFKFRRQHPIAGYILDFYCIKTKTAVELDGEQHGDPDQEQYDAQRTAKLQEFRVRVLRFPDYEALKFPDAVVDTIYRELTEGSPSPLPSPGVPGEGEEASAR